MSEIVYPAIWFTSGTPLKLGQSELWKRIESYISPEPMSGCWLWTGGAYQNRYGRINVAGEMCYAHRVVYTLLKGEIPLGLTIDHLCRVTFCVNPDHLEPVTRSENMRRRPDVQATGARTHCAYGHSRWGIHSTPPKRFCLECHRLTELARRAEARRGH
jgi:hypothetical protein